MLLAARCIFFFLGDRNILESDHIIADLNIGNTFANRLNYTGTFVAQDHRESTLGILAGKRVGI